jgi:hypothetical protein
MHLIRHLQVYKVQKGSHHGGKTEGGRSGIEPHEQARMMIE